MKKLIATVAIIVILGGCADDVTLAQAMEMTKVGFWYGLWHGLILPLSWVISLFSDYSIYAIYNNGGWYDFGFVLGCGALAGGSSMA